MTLIGLKAGRNVLVDGSLRDAKWYIQYVQNLKNEFAELNVGIIYVTASLETLLHRAQARAQSTGRHVPSEVIEKTYEQVPRSVTDLTPYADAIITFENDVEPNMLRCDEHSCLLEPICHNVTYPKLEIMSALEIEQKQNHIMENNLRKSPSRKHRNHNVFDSFLKKDSRNNSKNNFWWREEFRKLFEITCLISDLANSRKSESTSSTCSDFSASP